MNLLSRISSVSFVCIIAVILSSCSEEEVTAPLEAVTFRNLNADYAPLVFNPGAPPSRPLETKKYTFFSFKTGQVVPNSDSASLKWDIAFRSTSIIFNSGTSGPGNAGVAPLMK